MPVVYYKNPLGFARIEAEDNQVVSILIYDEPKDDATESCPAVVMAIEQLDEYFAGTRLNFDFPYRQKGTDFQQEVWQELEKIDYGKTITYAQQANRMNNPLGIRAIASANGRNHMWVVVPCHRVVGSDGSLTGYAGGLWRKQWLLQHEAKVLGVGQTSLF